MSSTLKKAWHRQQFRDALKGALIEFGVTPERAGEISNSDFSQRLTVFPFRYGSLEIDAGLVNRAIKNGA